MAISGGRIFIHYATIRAERYLLLLVLTIIDGHPSQALSVDPMRTYDHWWVSFIDRPPQTEVRRGVQILLSGLLPFIEAKDPGTDFLDFLKVVFVQLELSFPEGCLRGSGRGCGLSLIGFQFLSYFGGSGTIFGTTCHGLAATFQESKGKFDFEEDVPPLG